MEFRKKKNKWYPHFYLESKNGQFAIGIEDMLFGRMRIQVLHDSCFIDMKGLKGPNSVIREYPSYDSSKVGEQIVKIVAALSVLPDNLDGQKDWKKVEELLPIRDRKYLEDPKPEPNWQ